MSSCTFSISSTSEEAFFFSPFQALRIYPAQQKRVKGVQQRGAVQRERERMSVRASVSAQDRGVELRSGLVRKFRRPACPRWLAQRGPERLGLSGAGSARRGSGSGWEGEGSPRFQGVAGVGGARRVCAGVRARERASVSAASVSAASVRPRRHSP